jgi:predicted DNA-binding antitoxin AbrB/MazE fold protein
MNEWIEAVFEAGAFRPQSAVHFAEGQRVSIYVEPAPCEVDDLAEVRDLLDIEYTYFCQRQASSVPSLEQARSALSVFQGSLADLIGEEHNER